MRTPIAIAALALAACHHGHRDVHVGGGTPVFLEQERNDDPLTANRFGVIRPGDRFFIDGSVRDDLVDPFDGFAFTAGEPLHVDFQLFENNAAADLDVCLYDPLLDQTVACFATDAHPEQGGVDVFGGGLDFHLVIESFSGDSTYSLEIVVLPLFAREADEGALGAGAGLVASGASLERTTAAASGYRRERPVSAQRVLLEQVIRYDAESGILFERRRFPGME